MPLYEFVSEDGDYIERLYPMSKVPSLGTKITVDGTVYRRCISVGRTQVRKEFKPYVCVSKPKGLPGCKTDPKTGRSIIETRKQEIEIGKRRGEEWL